MEINIEKTSRGMKLNLEKDSKLVSGRFTVKWTQKPQTTTGQDFDMDLLFLGCGSNGKVLKDSEYYNVYGSHPYTIYYNHPANMSNPTAIEYSGDNRKGGVEVVNVRFDMLPDIMDSFTILTNIHEAVQRKQSFGQIQEAAVVAEFTYEDGTTKTVEFDLDEDFSSEHLMVFVKIYRHNGVWKFNSLGQGYVGTQEKSALITILEQFDA